MLRDQDKQPRRTSLSFRKDGSPSKDASKPKLWFGRSSARDDTKKEESLSTSAPGLPMIFARPTSDSPPSVALDGLRGNAKESSRGGPVTESQPVSLSSPLPQAVLPSAPSFALPDDKDFHRWRSSGYDVQWSLLASESKTPALYQSVTPVCTTAVHSAGPLLNRTGSEVRADWVGGALSLYDRSWSSLKFELLRDDDPESSYLALLKRNQRLGITRDIWTVPRVPFLASPARHFVLTKMCANIPNLAEPVACSIAFYERDLREKLTPDIFLSLPLTGAAHVTTETRKFLFTVVQASKDIVLVIRLYKLWRPTVGTERCFLVNEMTAAQRVKYQEQTDAMASSPLRSTLWEPFATASCPTLRARSANQAGRVSSTQIPGAVLAPSSLTAETMRAKSSHEALSGHVTLSELFEAPRASKDSVFDLMTRGGLDTPVNPMFLLPGSISLEVDCDAQNVDAEASIVRVPPFPSSLAVHTSAFNDLYITITKLVLSPKVSAGTAWLVQALFKASARAAPEVMGEREGRFDKPQQTSVARLEKNACEWFDEIHMVLPLMLQRDAQIVLQISSLTESEIVPLYSLLIPLFEESQEVLFADGVHAVALPAPPKQSVVCEVNGQLITPEAVGSASALFFRSRFRSSTYQSESSLLALQPLFPGAAAAPKTVRAALETVQTIPRVIERANFPLILSLLLEAAVEHAEKEEGTLALCEAFTVIERLHMSYPDSTLAHHPFLTSFASCMYTPRESLLKTFASHLVALWLRVMEEKASVPSLLEKMTLSRSWFLLECIAKSALLAAPVKESLAVSSGEPGKSARNKATSPSNSASWSPLQGRPNLPPPAPPTVPPMLKLPVGSEASKAAGESADMPQSPTSQSGRLEAPDTPKSTGKKIVVKTRLAASLSGSLPSVAPPKPRPSAKFESDLLVLVGKLLAITAHFESPESAVLSMVDLAKISRIVMQVDRALALDLLEYIFACLATLTKLSNGVPLLWNLVRAMPDWIAFNMPRPIPFSASEDHCEARYQAHPLCGLLVKHVLAEVSAGPGAPASDSFLAVLVHVLASHDATLKGDAMLRAAAIEMYFPLVVKLVEVGDTVVARIQVGNGALFGCWLYVLSTVPLELRRAYWQFGKRDSTERCWAIVASGLRRAPQAGLEDAFEGECLAVLSLLSDFISCPSTESFNPALFSSGLFGALEAIYDHASLLAVHTLLKVIELSKEVAKLCAEGLFAGGTRHCQILVLPTVFLCNSESDAIRNQASAFLLWLIELEEAHKGSFKQVHLACTIAISRFAAENQTGDVYRLKKSLDSVVASAQSKATLSERLAEMINSLLRALNSSGDLRTFEMEPEMRVEICQRISDGYAGSPDLRVTWLKIISDFNRLNHAPAEAAQAHLIRAYLITQFLVQSSGENALSGLGAFVLRELLRLCPFLSSKGFLGITSEDIRHQGAALTLDCWCADGLASELFDAGNLLTEAGAESGALSCYNLCIILRKDLAKPMDLLPCYSAAHMCCKSFVRTAGAPKPEEKFFRARFVGKLFGPLNDKSFVYRGEPSHRLLDFSNFIVKRCEDNRAAYGALEVSVLGNDKEATAELLEQTKCLYVQVARVYPVDGSASVFSLELAHSETEKKQQQVVGMQGRKKLIFRCATSFPFFNRRIPIVETTVVILTPLENAVAIMTTRVDALRDAVATRSPSVISGILYGNVMTTIAEGPEAVAEAFLATPGEDKVNVEKLRTLMASFLTVTLEALRLHESIMSADMKEWQREAMERYVALEKRLRPYCANK